jgi:hypothetical protein
MKVRGDNATRYGETEKCIISFSPEVETDTPILRRRYARLTVTPHTPYVQHMAKVAGSIPVEAIKFFN